MEDATQVSQPSPPPSPPGATAASLTFSIDLITRLTATALLAVYGIGFVILGFHDARYGVVQFSPFRARIALVGLVFATLVALTALADPTRIPGWDNLQSVRADADPKLGFFKETILAAGFIFTASLMATILSAFLFSSVHGQPAWKWWRWLIWLAAYFLVLGAFDYINKIFTSKPRIAALLAGTAYVIFLAATTALFPSSLWAKLALFFALVRFEMAKPREVGGTRKWLTNPFTWPIILWIVWIYISWIFILLPPRWGGGQPTPIVVYLNNAVPWSAENPMQVLLLDETDQGLYVLLSPSGKAFFVPRSKVASVFFGTK